MTPRISLVTAIAVLAGLALVPTAWGNHQYGDRFDRAQPATVRVSPDLVDRVVAAKQHELSNMLDARERGLGANLGNGTVSPLEARERAFAAKRNAQLSSGPYPDAIERAVATRGTIRNPVGDDRFLLDPNSVPTPISITTSGSEIEWPQIGIGFGTGILLALGLVLALRLTRIRPLAH